MKTSNSPLRNILVKGIFHGSSHVRNYCMFRLTKDFPSGPLYKTREELMKAMGWNA